MLKRCTRCKKEKDIFQFSRNNRAKDGRHSWCKVCINKRIKYWASKSKENLADNYKRYTSYNY